MMPSHVVLVTDDDGLQWVLHPSLDGADRVDLEEDVARSVAAALTANAETLEIDHAEAIEWFIVYPATNKMGDDRTQAFRDAIDSVI